MIKQSFAFEKKKLLLYNEWPSDIGVAIMGNKNNNKNKNNDTRPPRKMFFFNHLFFCFQQTWKL